MKYFTTKFCHQTGSGASGERGKLAVWYKDELSFDCAVSTEDVVTKVCSDLINRYYVAYKIYTIDLRTEESVYFKHISCTKDERNVKAANKKILRRLSNTVEWEIFGKCAILGCPEIHHDLSHGSININGKTYMAFARTCRKHNPKSDSISKGKCYRCTPYSEGMQGFPLYEGPKNGFVSGMISVTNIPIL